MNKLMLKSRDSAKARSDPFADDRQTIIDTLDEIIKEEYGEDSIITKMISPYFGKRGKKLRPLLSIYVYRLIKGDDAPLDRLLPILASIEIAHNASLIVDDIFDRDEMRRGDLAFFVKHGTFAALSIAYNLSAFVFDLATRTKHAEVVRTVGKAASQLSSALFLSKDLKSSKVISEEFFMEILRRKTSSLFMSAAKCAVLLATDDPITIEKMTQFGDDYGTAYQLRDDILAIEGTFDDLGKEPDSDITNRFQSLITIEAMRRANPDDRRVLEDYYLRDKDYDPELIRQILIRSGGTAAVKEHCKTYKQKCYDVLADYPESETKMKLKALIDIISI